MAQMPQTYTSKYTYMLAIRTAEQTDHLGGTPNLSTTSFLFRGGYRAKDTLQVGSETQRAVGFYG